MNEVEKLQDSNTANLLYVKKETDNTNRGFKKENPIDRYLNKVGYTMYHHILLVFSCLMSFMLGSELGISNIILSSLARDFHLQKYSESLIGASLFLGITITSTFCGYFNNKCGRKYPSVIGCLIVCAFSSLSSFSHNLLEMCLVKMFIGAGLGIIVPGILALITETIPVKNRSLTLNFIWAPFALGIIYVCLIAIKNIHENFVDWRTTCFINSLTPIPVVILSFFLRESPRYLITMGSFKEGIIELNNIGGNIVLTEEEQNEIFLFHKLKKEKQEDEEGIKWLYDNYLKGQLFYTSIFLMYICYAVGFINYGLLYTLPKHLEETAKNKEESLYEIIIAMYILFLCPFVRGLISEISFIGRIGALILGFLASFISSILCIVMHNKLPLLSGILVFSIEISSGVVKVYLSEIYPTRIRSIALGIGNAFIKVGAMSAPFICDFVDSRLYKGSFYMFIISSFMGILASYFLKVETLGMPLDESIDDNLSKKE